MSSLINNVLSILLNIRLLFKVISIFTVLSISTSALAESDSNSLTVLSGGFAYVSEFQGSDDYVWIPIPVYSIYWDDGSSLEIGGLSANWNISKDKKYSYGLQGSIVFGRSDVSDPVIKRMKPLDDTINFGPYGAVKLQDWTFELGITADIGGANDGILSKLSAGTTLYKQGENNLQLTFKADYANQAYMQTYFSVNLLNSIRTGLPLYRAEAGFLSSGLSFSYTHQLSSHWNLYVSQDFSRLSTNAADSPIVSQRGNKNQYITFVLFSYLFY
ncbi:MAG: MipA/OmpV family protein [Pseudomonadota bacterium]